jgi:hypothetical protein
MRIVSFLLLAACEALCQKPPSASLLQESKIDGSNSPAMQRQEMPALPDAPSSVQHPAQAGEFHRFVNEASPPLTLSAVTFSAGAVRESELLRVTPGPQPISTALYRVAFIPAESSAFLSRYLSPPLPNPRYYASTSDSFMGRASYAASRIFVTRDDSGKGRLNTRYFLGVLSSLAIHVAYRPSRARSTSETFNSFGSTIGSDAGMNVYHEFGPGIQRMVKGLTPKFVARIEERITRSQTPRNVVFIPAR